METNDVGFFAKNNIPVLSEERITFSQIEKIFEMKEQKYNRVLFD
jgi:hypothetical protein